MNFIPQDRFDARDFRVGDVLWFDANRTCSGRASKAVTITKIGRSWVTLCSGDRFRIRADRLCVDGGQYASPGRLYASEEACRKNHSRDKLFKEFLNKLHWRAEDDVTSDDIRQAAKLLRIELKNP